jgi:hypothetical protein
MPSIRTTTLATAVLGIGLLLGACASPATNTATRVVPATSTPPAPPAPVAATVATATAAAAPVVHAVPVAQIAPVAVAPATPPPPPVATATATTTAATPTAATPPPSATASPVATSSPGASTPASGSAPHFTTPDDAMRYLVAAYNAHDLTSEMHVTTPDSRAALETERQWVNTFSFHSCTLNPGGGDYSCQFDMVSKVATTDQGTDGFGDDLQQMGEITVLVAPAQRPGWYMYYNEGCGG